MLKRSGFVSLFLLVASPGLLCPAAAADSARDEYLQLRKNFIIVSALAPRKGGLRPDHLNFLRQSTRYLHALPEENATYRAAVLYLRGRLLLHVNLNEKARQDFDACLALLQGLPQDDLPVGVPGALDIKVYRAFTTLDEELDAFLTELEQIPKDQLLSGLNAAGDKLRVLARELVERQQFDQAIRIHKIVKKYGLWNADDHQDPDKIIEILQYQKKNVEGTE